MAADAAAAAGWGRHSSAESEHAVEGRRRRRRRYRTQQPYDPELASGTGHRGCGSARALGQPVRGGIWGGWHRGWHPRLALKYGGRRRRRRGVEVGRGRRESLTETSTKCNHGDRLSTRSGGLLCYYGNKPPLHQSRQSFSSSASYCYGWWSVSTGIRQQQTSKTQ